MSERVLFMHPPREDFIATMSDAERAAFDAHAAWLRGLLADGLLTASGPRLGWVNTGIAIFETAREGEGETASEGETQRTVGWSW
jgi:hypothetical protein